eukprot:612935-Amphidinium_carterae.1
MGQNQIDSQRPGRENPQPDKTVPPISRVDAARLLRLHELLTFVEYTPSDPCPDRRCSASRCLTHSLLSGSHQQLFAVHSALNLLYETDGSGWWCTRSTPPTVSFLGAINSDQLCVVQTAPNLLTGADIKQLENANTTGWRRSQEQARHSPTTGHTRSTPPTVSFMGAINSGPISSNSRTWTPQGGDAHRSSRDTCRGSCCNRTYRAEQQRPILSPKPSEG